MYERTTVARPYARAIFAVAREAGQLNQWSERLALLESVVGDPAMAALIKNPSLGAGTVAGCVLSVCGDQLNQTAQQLVRLLAEAKRLVLASEIRTLYEGLKAAAEDVVECRVDTAYPLSEPQQKKISSIMSEHFGGRVEIDERSDETLIGGVVIRVGDAVIDSSIKGRLETMAARIIDR